MGEKVNGASVEQPAIELQRLLDSVLNESRTDVEFMGKTISLGWLHYEQVRKFSHVVLTEEDARKRDSKLCAILLLDGRWKMLFRYWWLWRKLYWFSDLDPVETLRLLDAAKKKIPSTACSLNTILATGMTDVMMTMRKAEVDASRAARPGVVSTP